MQVGFIGSGNMARALARGWGDPVLCTDSGSGRAQRLAEELGGEAVATNRELAERADVVILAHKPAQLADVRSAYPGVPSFRVEPNTAVEVGRGVLVFAASDAVETDPTLRERLTELFGRLGAVVEVPERLMEVAGACSGVWSAYWALPG